MKPMIYKPNKERKVLHNGTYKGYNFYIVSYGTHPCAYVEIPVNHVWYGHYCWDKIDTVIDCHGGLTFLNDLSHVLGEDAKYRWFVGWDYAHAGDYYESLYFKDDGKKWSTEEILEEVKEVIERIIKFDKKETLL